MRAPIEPRGWRKSELTLSASKPWESPEDFERRMAAMLRDFDKDSPGHLPSCICPNCLYRIYERSKKGPGRKWGRDLFLVAWLLHEAKVDYLLRRERTEIEEGPWSGGGRARRVRVRPFWGPGLVEELNRYCGVRILIYRTKDYDDAPSWNLVRRILSNHRTDLLDLLPAYSQRVKAPAFRKVLAAIMKEKLSALRAEHERLGPPLPAWEPDKALALSMKIREFIFSQPSKRATRRELQRKFRVSAAEVDASVSWLEGHDIYHKQIAHKLQHKRTGYRNKRTFVYAVKKPS